MKRISTMRHASIKLAALVVLAVSLAPCERAAAAAEPDLLEKGKQLYMHGDYPNAEQYLEKEIGKDPKNASAHYLLGNVFFAQKRMPEAAKEYEQAATLAPNTEVGQYSRLALTSVATSSATQAVKQPAVVQTQSAASSSGDPDKEAMKSSVRAISRQADQQQAELSQECQGRLRDIQRDADSRIAQLKEEMDSKVAANGSPTFSSNRYGRVYMVYNPGPANKAIQDEYQTKMDAVRSEASKKADEVTAYFKNRQASVNESAMRIDKGYLQPDANSRVQIVPRGTDMYTHNYQTKDDPSGNPVPVMAPPAKSLQQTSNRAHR